MFVSYTGEKIMKILVTGGCGFIGSSLVEQLLKNHEVIVLDNLSNLKKETKAKLIKGDVRNREDVEKAMHDCEFIFHLAAQIDVQESIKDPDKDYDINVNGTRTVVEACKKFGAKIIFPSTAAVYGNAEVPIKEDAEKKPMCPYGENKLFAEELCQEINHFIVRPFNVYGPGGKGVIPKFCEKIMNDQEILITNPTSTRDYIFIDDVIDALLLGIKHNGIYNVGSGKETTLDEIVKIIEKLTGKKAKIKYGKPLHEIERSVADITKIKKLGWKPKTSLEEGIKKTLGLI